MVNRHASSSRSHDDDCGTKGDIVTRLRPHFLPRCAPAGTVKLRHQADSDIQHVGPRRRLTTISCGSITPIFVNLTIPSRSMKPRVAINQATALVEHSMRTSHAWPAKPLATQAPAPGDFSIESPDLCGDKIVSIFSRITSLNENWHDRGHALLNYSPCLHEPEHPRRFANQVIDRYRVVKT